MMQNKLRVNFFAHFSTSSNSLFSQTEVLSFLWTYPYLLYNFIKNVCLFVNKEQSIHSCFDNNNTLIIFPPFGAFQGYINELII